MTRCRCCHLPSLRFFPPHGHPSHGVAFYAFLPGSWISAPSAFTPGHSYSFITPGYLPLLIVAHPAEAICCHHAKARPILLVRGHLLLLRWGTPILLARGHSSLPFAAIAPFCLRTFICCHCAERWGIPILLAHGHLLPSR